MERNKHLFKLMMAVCLLIANCTFAQQTPSKEVRAKLQEVYNSIKNPETSFEKFLKTNAHVIENKTNAASITNLAATTSAIQDTYCNKVRPYCPNGDFEAAVIDQNQYTGAYGFWPHYLQPDNLYPDPFALTYGFVSGALSDGSAHQTIVKKSSGNDPITGIPLVAANGGNQALRLGNTDINYGTELIAKTVVVDPSQTILNFYYAVVLQDPGHPRIDQPAFSVRVYDCATGLELPNVCNLGNNTNIAVSDASNPFFKSLNSSSYGIIAYRDWSRAQIDLSSYVGKTVIIVFTNKDCGQGGHWGYTYLDNLFSTQCPVPPLPTDPTLPDPGTIQFDTASSSSCGIGKICAKYSLPKITNLNITTTGSIAIDLKIYQNGTFLKTITSPTLTSGSSYCFSVDPGTLGLAAGSTGFDYSLTGNFALSGFSLAPIIVGNPPNGLTAGQNNDYTISCNTTPPTPPQTGLCPSDITIAANPLTCKTKVTWTEPVGTFPDSIAVKSGQGLAPSILLYKGISNGHAYYESNDHYTWTDARDAASAVGAHLITINSAAENNFVTANFMEKSSYAWIGLYNTGTFGSFAWVTGEPLNFTNWIPGEPDNYYNEPNNPTIYEPYVHINGYDSLMRWNDIGGNIMAQFLAEFDSSVYTYKQVSGPMNGDSLMAGVYTVCYERTNRITGTTDNCCFKITVTCTSITSGCPSDTTITADPLTCQAKVRWTVPSMMFPNTIAIAKGSGISSGLLNYKGTLNGHGYYQSSDLYTWPDARTAATNAGGHLITITSAAENNFLINNFNQTNNFAWIGLYNTGSVGSFAWVTGEPLSYTNWITGEPDNLYSSLTDATIYEPYVQINGYYDNTNRWNDAGNVSSNFLAEFDSPVISYKQISGPTNGDLLSPGVYRVCYEIANSATQTKDTCCFNITVVCNNTTAANSITTQNVLAAEAGSNAFNAIAYPNPSKIGFQMKVTSDNSKDKITMKVVDLTGRMIETKNSIIAGSMFSFGNKYAPGIYFTTITQGSKVIVMKMIKQ